MAADWDGWASWHSSALTGEKPNMPSSVASSAQAYIDAGVPKAKLGVGIGFYGTCWAGGASAPRQPVGSSYVAADDNVMRYSRVMSTYYSPSAYHYDAIAEAPYLSFDNPTGPEDCTFVSYENARSVTAKGDYATAHGLGAEIVWTVNQAHVTGAPAGETDPLLRAVRRAFH
jgi:chitinase